MYKRQGKHIGKPLGAVIKLVVAEGGHIVTHVAQHPQLCGCLLYTSGQFEAEVRLGYNGTITGGTFQKSVQARCV